MTRVIGSKCRYSYSVFVGPNIEAIALKYGKLRLHALSHAVPLFPWQFILKSITLAQLVVVKELLRMMLLWHAILTKDGVSPLRSDPLYIQACYK